MLFTVAAVGYPLGRVKIGGTGLGIAAVLFVELATVAAVLGEPIEERLDLDRSHLDYRRILVSNPDVAGSV